VCRMSAERRKELAKLVEEPTPTERVNRSNSVDDLQTPLEIAARAAGLSRADLHRAAGHPHDPADYLITCILVAEGEAALRKSAAPSQPVKGGPGSGPGSGGWAAHAVADREELLALGNRDFAALIQQALRAGVNQPELAKAREHRYDRVGYLTTLVLVARQEERHPSVDASSVVTRRISTRRMATQPPPQAAWIAERLHAEGVAGAPN
jgi:hypothetical protein